MSSKKNKPKTKKKTSIRVILKKFVDTISDEYKFVWAVVLFFDEYK